eukprot:9053370-Pyramimonas_sp.AAC.1
MCIRDRYSASWPNRKPPGTAFRGSVMSSSGHRRPQWQRPHASPLFVAGSSTEGHSGTARMRPQRFVAP